MFSLLFLELDASYTYMAGIISGMVASLTLITTFTALRRIIHTMSRIKHVNMLFLYKTQRETYVCIYRLCIWYVVFSL